MITPLPSLDRTSPSFKTEVDTFFASQLPQFSVEAEAARVSVNAADISANASKMTAIASAAAALASELAAASYASAGRWVSGANYALDAVAWSPITGLLYRCTLAIAGGTVDPSVDTSHWSAPLVQGVSGGGTGATTAAGAQANLNVPARNGAGATGTWGINVTGSAGSAAYATAATTANALNPANNYTINNYLAFSAGTGVGYIRSDEPTWGMVHRPTLDGTTACHLFTGSGGGALAYVTAAGRVVATSMQASTFIGNLNGTADRASVADSATGPAFVTAVGTTGAQFTARLSGYADVALFSDTAQWGLYSVAGGLMIVHDRASGVNSFNGNVYGNAATATNAAAASYATNAGYAGNAGTVNSLGTYQVAVAYSAVGIFDIGSLIFAMIVSGSAGGGAAVDGSQLRLADDNGDTAGTTFGGTWICRGHAPTGHSTLWQRIA